MDLTALKKRLSVAIENPQFSSTPTTKNPVDWDSLIDKYSEQYPDVPKNIIKGILEQESGGDSNATGKETKYGTAKGPFQFIDSTAQQYIPGWKSPEDSYDPEKATAGAFNYVSALLKETGGDVKKAVGRYFGTGYDPVAKMDTNDYAGQVIEKSQKYNDSGTPFVAKEQSVRNNTGFDMEGLKGRLRSAIAGGKTLESYQPPVNVVPQQQPVMQPITGMQKPVDQPVDKKQLPFVGNFVEILKTMARTPISTIRGVMEGTGSALKKIDALGIDAAYKALENKKSKYKDGIPSEEVRKNWPALIPYETLKQAKMSNGNYDPDILAVILSDYKSKSQGFDPKAVTEPIKNIENVLKEKDVERLGGIGGVMQDLTSGVTQVAAQVGLKAINPSLAAGSMITLIGGSSIEELEKKGVDPMDGAALALANAALQYPLEKIGIGKIVDNMAVKNATGKVLKRVVSSFLGEGVTEGIQEIPDYILTDWFVKTKGMDLKEKIDTLVKDLPELGKRAGYSVVIGGLTGSAVTGAGIAIDQAINGKDRVEKKSIEDAWNTEMVNTQQKLNADPDFQRAMNAPDLTGTMQPIVDMQGYRDRVKAEQVQGDESIAGKIASEQQQPEVETPEGLKPEPEMKPIVQQPEEDTGPQQVDATEEQINVGKTLAVNNGKVVFQKSSWGMKATNPNTGEKVDIKPKFEFKDKETNGNITMSLDEISSPDAENILETKILEQRKAFEEGEKFRKEKGLTPTSELDAQDKASKLKKEKLNAEAIKKEDSNEKSVRVDEGVSKRKGETNKGERVEVSDISNGIDDVPSVQPVTEKQEENAVSPEIAEVSRPEEQKAEIEAINTNPTEPQKEAGNYRKAHIKRDGMDISIENAAGQERKGTDKAGKEWKVTMNHDYGYIRGTKGADAYRGRATDQLDVFIKPDAPEGGDVFVINQKDPTTGKFDEHKALIGFANKIEAAKAYKSNYEKGWKGLKSVVRMPMDQFKKWAYSEDTKNELTQEIADKYKTEQTGVTKNKLEDTNNIKEKANEKETSKKTETVLNEKVETPSLENEVLNRIKITDRHRNDVEKYSKAEFAKLYSNEVKSEVAKAFIDSTPEIGYDKTFDNAVSYEGTIGIAKNLYDKIKAEKDTDKVGSPSSDPNTQLVNDYVQLIKTHHGNKEKIPNTRKILDLADKAHGGTIAEGKYGIRDAYDALETAMNKYVEEIGLDEDPKETIKKLNNAIKVLPTQTVRTEDQVEKQQFSTPPSEAYLAVMASGIKEGMTGLEPSAGDGNIATIMRLANKSKGEIYTNEIDERRRNNLKILGFNPTDADAEYLHSTLPKEIQPDVVVMNPPFSATGGRLKQHDTGFGAEHVRQALLRLKDGGRLVAIVGNGMAFGKPKMASWWNGIRDKYNVRANVGISGKEYEKYGTGFDNNIIVIDKTGKTGTIENIITGSNLTVEQAYDLLAPLMKEDVNGRIKRDSASGAEKVGSKKPEGKTSEEKPTVRPDTATSGRPGRGSAETAGAGTDKATVENMGESGKQLPGEGGADDSGKIVEGSKTSRSNETKRAGDEGAAEDLGDDDTGGSGRKPSGEGRVEEEENSVYAKYNVKKATYSGSVPHQANIVESATMASVDLPNVTYKLNIPKEIIKKGAPSDIQLEAATYAGQTHEQLLPDGRRKEFLLGDSTGTGKTITILTTIYDNWMRGRKKAVVITKSKGLIKDLRDDMKMMGIDIPVIDLSEYKMSEAVEVTEGILFSTYATASGGWTKGRERYNQIKNWFGKDNDGVFVFDEAHLMKNASAETPTNTGSMGIKFKDELKNARFLNASATAATNSKNLAYLTRMGLWGEGSSFKNFNEFLGTMTQGGLGAMELLSRDMKANGNYISRTISYKGVDYETLNHTMNETEIASYNSMADFWSEILQRMDEAAKNSGLKGRAARNHAKQYYAAQQRFFLQLMVSFQVETMLKDADKKLNDGKSVVISLFNTNEQQTEKKVGDAQAQGVDIDDMDFTPRDMMIDMIKKNFPVDQYQEVQRDDGTKEYVKVTDKAGNPLKNAENEAIMNELVDKVATFKMPDNPLDRIVNYFGEGKVSEVTGRKKRLVMVNGKKVYKARATKDVSAKDVNRNELDQFMDGKKRVAVLSGAAATGFSFHSSTKKKNQQRRVFYALQLSWSADQQMQAFGRVHRTMQANAPEIVLVQTDIASQKRLVNTIQSRLASLGAISKGERESLSGGIFSIEDITDEYGDTALRDVLSKMSMDKLKRMGLVTETGKSKEVDVDGFLNRLMVLQVKDQNEIFDQFYGKYRDAVDKAKEAGLYDTGVEKIKGENVRIEGEPILLSDDKQSGVKTEILNIAHDVETVKRTFKQANERLSGKRVIYVRNKKSGDPYMAYVQESNIHIYGPRWILKKIPYTQVREEFDDKYEKVEDGEFEKLWNEKYKEIPKVSTQHTHIVTGSIFNNYKKIFEASAEGSFSNLKVKRAVLDNGVSKIGVYIPQSMIEKIKQNFGIGTDLVTASPEKIVELVRGGSIIEFDNRWKLKKSKVMGDERIELNIGNDYNTGYIEKMGLFNEIIAGQKRYFVPTGDTMIETIKNIMDKTKPVRDLTVKSEESAMASALAVPTFKITDLAKSVTPAPVKVNPIQTVKAAPSGKKLQYAQASNKLGNQITDKEDESRRDTGFISKAEAFYQKWVDLAFPISKVEDIYNEDMGIKRETARKIDIAIDRVRGAGGMSKQFIDDNLKPIFDNIKENKGEVSAELSKYLVAVRTKWLYENKKSYADIGIDKGTADDFVEFIDTGAHPYSSIIKESAQKVWEYGKKLLEIKKEHGIIDDELSANLSEPFYVPFYRSFQDEKIAKSVPRGERFTTISKGIKKIKGSLTGRKIIDPIQNMMEHTYETMVNAYRADVANLLVDMAEESEAIGEMFQKINPKWVKVGTIEHRGTMDVVLRPQIDEVAKELGITTEYKTKLAARVGRKLQKVLGRYQEGGKLQMLVGATEETYAHELGHGIHEKYSWYDTMVEKYDTELNAVADTRHAGVQVPVNFVKYCKEKSEKAAEFISLYITDRDSLKTLVPKMLIEFEGKIQSDPVLKKLIEMKPSNVKGLITKEENNFVMDWHVPQDADVISVLREGKIVSYKVPIEVADAVKNLHPAMFPAWFRIMMMPNRVLKRMAVSLNLDFMFPNMFRDQQEAAINARTIPAVDWLIGLKEYAFGGDYLKRYFRAGGGMESVESGVRGFSKSAENIKYGSSYGKFLDTYYWQETGKLRGATQLSLEAFKFPFKIVEKLAEASEMASRIGTFRRAQVGYPEWLEWYGGKKKSEEQAMHIARQATLDFQRFGSHGRTLNEVIPFLNAAIQGIDRMVRTFKDDYKRALLSAMGYAITPTIGLFLWNRGKELYKAINFQEKLNNFIVMLPDGSDYVKIPKGHITKFIINPIQAVIEKLNGTLTKENGSVVVDLLSDISPVELSSLPITLRMILEPVANYDFYWKKQIETPAMQGISKAGLRTNSRTSYLIKQIGKAINISPAMIQHETELLGAGTAKNALWVADNILVMAGVSDGSLDAAKFGVEQAPIARRFYGKVTEWGSDIDEAIRDVNTQLSKMNETTIRQMRGRLRYSDKEINEVIKSNNELKSKLYIKRGELEKAKGAITELLKNQE